MKNFMKICVIFIITSIVFTACEQSVKNDSDKQLQEQTEQAMIEANNQVGLPAIVNYQEKKLLKWIYELCDQEDLICYAYLWNEYNGKLVFIGKCLGYGIPYSTQFSNPEKLVDVTDFGINSYHSNDGVVISQAEPNGLFKPVGLSATWLIMLDDKNEPRPVYIEPSIIVSPFPLQ